MPRQLTPPSPETFCHPQHLITKMSEDLGTVKKEEKVSKAPSLDYFILTGKTEKGFKVYTCTFCKTTLTQKITRFNEHLLLRCPKITDEAKDDLMSRLPGKSNFEPPRNDNLIAHRRGTHKN